MEKLSIDEMATFCKRKGFVYPSGELYGGLAGFWDFGPLGLEIKKNIFRIENKIRDLGDQKIKNKKILLDLEKKLEDKKSELQGNLNKLGISINWNSF